MLSEEQARDKVCEFLIAIGRDGGFGRERLKQILGEADEDENPNVGPMWTFESSLGSFSVSKRSGDVVMYSATEPEQMGKPTIGDAEADEIARRFIRAVYPGFDERAFRLREKEEAHGYFEYHFEQMKGPGEVSIFQNAVSVSVRADLGMVTDYSSSNLPFKRSTAPRISEAEARRLVEGEIGDRKGVIESLELVEHAIEGASRTITVWKADVVYRGGKFEVPDVVLINADSGEVVEAK